VRLDDGSPGRGRGRPNGHVYIQFIFTLYELSTHELTRRVHVSTVVDRRASTVGRRHHVWTELRARVKGPRGVRRTGRCARRRTGRATTDGARDDGRR